MNRTSFTLIFSILFLLDVVGATFTANSPGGDWNTPSTWIKTGTDADGIPDSDDDVVINAGATITVNTDNQQVRFLTINSSGILTFNNVNTFTVNNVLKNDGLINGTLAGAQKQLIFAGTLWLYGSGIMSITGDIKLNTSGTFDTGSNVNNTGQIIIGDNGSGSGWQLINKGNISLTQSIDGTLSSSKCHNYSSGYIKMGTNPFLTAGQFFFSGGSQYTNNTLEFSGTTNYTLKFNTYENLVISGTGIINTASQANTIINKNLTISSGSQLNQDANRTLAVLGNLTNNGAYTSSGYQALYLLGNLTNNGTINSASNQFVIFQGSSNQSINGSGSATISNLTINNSNGVNKTTGNITITDLLTIQNGNLNNSGGNFILKSDATKYARIGPIASSCASCSFSGSFTIERYIPARTSATWADLSSPVSNSNMQDWDNELYLSYPHDPYGATPVYSNVVFYDETTADYSGVDATTALTSGKGFEITLADDSTLTSLSSTTLNTIGTPNYGTQTINLSYTNNSGNPYPTGYDGENLIGNPFASAIILSSITKTNTLSTIDIYDNVTNNFVTLSGSKFIAPYQGFWAYALGAGASFTIPESAKASKNNSTIRSMESDIEPYMQLALLSADGSHMMAHTLKIASDVDANDGWDLKDHPFRKSPNKKAPSITANSETFPLSISTFNSNHLEYSMPLNTQVGIAGKYQINISGLEFINKDYSCVLLEDKKLNQSIDLSIYSNYTFFALPNDSKDRFVVHFSKNGNCKSSYNSSITNTIDDQVMILPTINGNKISFNFSETINSTISVTNLLGQNIVEGFAIAANNQTIELGIPENFKGMYIIKIETEKGIVSKKFVKK